MMRRNPAREAFQERGDVLFLGEQQQQQQQQLKQEKRRFLFGGDLSVIALTGWMKGWWMDGWDEGWINR